MTIEWNTAGDWEENQDQSGFAHESSPDIGYDDPDTLYRGYSYDEDLTRGLVGWWPLHESSVSDLSGEGNDGESNGGVTFGVAGRSGLEAASFDGSDDWIDTSLNTNNLDSPVTISLWIKRTAAIDKSPLVSGYRNADPDGNRWDIQVDRTGENKVGLIFHGGNRIYSTTSIDQDVWYHISIIHDLPNSEGKIFIDGIQNNSGSISTSLHTNVNLEIANGDNGQLWDGKIQDVRIYDRALSESEIQTLYEWGNANVANDPRNGTGWYRLDGDASDSFGSNDGTNNGATFVDDSIRGQAGDFNGSDDYVDVPNSLLEDSSSDFTISAWIKPRDISELQQVVGCLSFSDNGAGIYINDSSLEFRQRGTDNTDQVVATPLENEWLLATFVMNSQTIEGYVNGELVDTIDVNENSYSNDVVIGTDAGQNYFYDGFIDDVRFYDRALSQEDIFDLYQWGTRGIDMTQKTVKY